MKMQISVTTPINPTAKPSYTNSTKSFRIVPATGWQLTIDDQPITHIVYSRSCNVGSNDKGELRPPSSYYTIIAVITADKLYRTNHKYSVTTSKHWGQIPRICKELGLSSCDETRELVIMIE